MKIKRTFFIVVLLLTMMLVIRSENTADAYVGDTFTYSYEGQTITYEVLSEPTETTNGTARIINAAEINQNLTGVISIPATVTNQRMTYDVIKLAPNAFMDAKGVTDIILPDTITEIGKDALRNCSGLTSVNIPQKVTRVEEGTFYGCSNLTFVDLPEGITMIGDKAFYRCDKLTELHLSDDIISIGEYAFYECKSLTSIKIPYQVTNIKKYTFYGCSSLTKIRIGGEVTGIGDFAFYNCTSLVSLNLPDELTSIGFWSFYGCESMRPMIIPSTVTSIGLGQFPYSGVFVYNNSYSKAFFQKNFPTQYQLVKLPLKEMFFNEDIRNIEIGQTVDLEPQFYPKYSSDVTEIIWKSSDSSIVAVDTDGKIKGLIAGEADITAEMGEFSAVCHIIVEGAISYPVSIKLNKSDIKMNTGEDARLQLTFTPENSTKRKITWTSSDDSIVTVENGCLYANRPGIVVITAQSPYAVARCIVTVASPLRDIYSDYNTITLNQGDTKKIAISFDPMDTTDDKSIIWKSTDESIVTVANGRITAEKAGSTIITATVGKLSHSIPVMVKVPIKSLSLSQEEISIIAGQSQSLSLMISPIDTNEDIKITSSDPSVAVYSNGKVTALKRGKATITVNAGQLTASCLVTVKTDIKSIMVNKTSLNLNLGSSETLTVTFNPTVVADDKTITWVSSDESIVSVDSKGKVKTVGVGTATITATAADNITRVCSVNVKLSVPGSFQVVSAGYDSVKLTWGTVSGVSGYRVYRSDSLKGTYVRIKETTSNSFTDTGLTSGKTYYYKVRGYRKQGGSKVYSSYTTVLSVVPRPNVPVDVKLVKMNSTKINFTWSKVNGASGYEIYRSSNTKSALQLVKTTTSLHYMNYGLTKGRTYQYKVRAYRIIGKQKIYSEFSAAFSVKI